MLQLEIGKCRNLTFEESVAVIFFSFSVFPYCFIQCVLNKHESGSRPVIN